MHYNREDNRDMPPSPVRPEMTEEGGKREGEEKPEGEDVPVDRAEGCVIRVADCSVAYQSCSQAALAHVGNVPDETCPNIRTLAPEDELYISKRSTGQGGSSEDEMEL